METTQISKKRNIAGWTAMGLVTAMLIMSGLGKIMANGDPDAMMYQNFAKWGLDGKLLLIAVGELVAVLLFIVPRTSSLGLLLISAHLGGAIAIHLANQEMAMMFAPGIIMVLAWVGYYLRFPEMLASFSRKR